GATVFPGAGNSTCSSSRSSKSGALSSSTTRWRASSSDAPRLIASSYCSARCCESSSTISASRTGGSLSSANRALISTLKSGMFYPRDEADRFDELDPATALLRQRLLARWRKAVIASATLPCFFNPATADPVSFLQPIEQRVERSDIESYGAARAQLNKLSNFITVPRAVFEERKNHQLRTALL